MKHVKSVIVIVIVAVFTGCRFYLLPFFPLPFLSLPLLPLPFLPFTI